jgi:hypothetical protein
MVEQLSEDHLVPCQAKESFLIGITTLQDVFDVRRFDLVAFKALEVHGRKFRLEFCFVLKCSRGCAWVKSCDPVR